MPPMAGNAQTVMAASAAVGQPKPRAARPAADAADRKRTRVDFDTIFQDVTALGASAFTGKDKKQWEAKRLAAAGAALAPRKEKMPLRMAIGVTKARKRRAAAAVKEAKLSGVITGKKLIGPKQQAAERREKSEQRARNNQHPSSLEPDNVRGPVMYVRKK